MVHHYINLFGGIEWLPAVDSPHPQIRFCRIQSTALEQKRFDFVIRDLDHGLLFDLSQGIHCVVYDVSAHKPESRAVYQGLVWVSFVLNYFWFRLEPTKISVRGQDCTPYFYSQLHALSKEAASRVKTYRKFLRTKELRLTSKCISATIVDNYPELLKMLEVMVSNEDCTCAQCQIPKKLFQDA